MKRFRKVIALVLVVSMMLQIMPTPVAVAETSKRFGDFLYSVLEDGTVSLDGYEGEEPEPGKATHVTIPAEIDGKPVTVIGQEAFAYCLFVDTIVIPANVTTIENAAFYHCEDLEALVFLGNTPELGFTLVEGNHRLEHVYHLAECDLGEFSLLVVNDIGEEEAAKVALLEYTDSERLMEAYEAYAVTLDARETSSPVAGISDDVVASGTYGDTITWEVSDGGETLSIYGTGTGVMEYPAYGDPSNFPWMAYRDTITQAHIGTGVTEIAAFALLCCPSLEYISVGSDVVSIGQEAFADNWNLRNVYFYGSAPAMGERVFGAVATTVQCPQRGGWEALMGNSYGGTLTWELYTVQVDSGHVTGENGEFLNWSLDSEGKLSLYGEYNMRWTSAEEYPWHAYREDILTVELDIGTGQIGDYAFYGCKNMNSFIQVTSGILSDREGVSGVFGAYSFAGCTSLKEITFYEGVEQIESHAFDGCTALEKLSFRCLPPVIAADAFVGVTALAEYDGTLSGWTEEVLQAYGGTLTWRDINDGVFGDFENLSWVLNTEGVLTISGTGAMSDEVPTWKGYSEQIKAVVIEDGVTSIGKSAFEGCDAMTSVVIPASVTAIGEYAFSGTGLTEVVIPATVTAVGAGAFSSCESLTKATVLAPLTSLPESMFHMCFLLTDLALPNTITVIEAFALSNTGLTEFEIPSTVTEIKDYAFRNSKLTSIVVPESVTTMGSSVFTGCSNLVSAVIEAPITALPVSTFEWCEQLEQLALPNTVTALGAFCLSGTNLKEFSVPAGVTEIGIQALSFVRSLEKVTIPASVTSIGESTFYGSNNLQQIVVDKNNPNYSNDDLGVLYNKDKTQLIAVPCGMQGEYVIPDTVTAVAVAAFSGVMGITKITVPASVTQLSVSALSEAAGLQKIVVAADHPNYSSDAYGVLYNKEKTEIIFVPRGITGEYVIPDTITCLTEGIMQFCSNLTHVVIPASVTTIEDGAFRHSGLVEVTIPATVENMGQGVFGNCKSLERAVVEASLSTLPMYTFSGCSSLKELELGEAFVSLGSGSLSGTGFTEFVVPTGIQTLEYDVMSYCNQLTSVVIPATVTAIGTYAFDGCVNLRTITFLGDMPTFGTDLFSSEMTAYYPVGNFTWNTIYEIAPLLGAWVTWVAADFEKPVVTSMAPKDGSLLQGDVTFSMAAEDNIGVTRMEMSYSLDGGATWTLYLAGNSGSFIQTESTLLWPDGELLMKVVAYDEAGNESEPCIYTYHVNNVGPGPITGLDYTSTLTSISLSWDHVPDEDWEYYRIQRKNEEGTFVSAYGILREPKITFNDLQPGTMYEYRVAALDIYGNVGDWAYINAATLPDEVPPTITSLTPGDGFIKGEQTFRAAATDNVGVDLLELYYSADGGATWIFFGASLGSIAAPTDTSKWPDGEVMVKAVATDAAGNVGEPMIRTYQVDNTGPAQVTGLTYESTITSITLSWEPVTDEDFAWYEVQALKEDGSYETLYTRLTDLGLTIQDLEPETTYTYRVVAVDQHENVGTPSENLAAATKADDVPPIVTELLPGGAFLYGEVNFTAAATDNLAVVRMEIFYSVDGGATWTLFGESETAALKTVLVTKELTDGEMLVKVVAYDAKGNASEPLTQEYKVDNTGPSVVADMVSIPRATKVTLNWEEVPESDLKYYRIEKMVDGEYVEVATTQETTWTEESLEPGTTHTYRISAVDAFGNVGECTEPLEVTTLIDGTAPKILQMTPAAGAFSGEIELSAKAEDNMAVGSITIQVSTDGIVWTDVLTQEYTEAATVQELTGKLSLEAYAEGSLYVRAVAADMSGNTCEPSSMVEHQIDKTAPAALSSVKADSGDGFILVYWSRGEDDVTQYQLHRAETEDGEYTMLRGDINGQNCYDRSAVPGTTYYYRVAAVDAAGNVGELSEIVSNVATPDVTAPQVLSIYPAEGKAINAAKAKISVLVSDNSALKSVVIAYSTDGENYVTLLENLDILAYNQIAEATIPTEALVHGAQVYIRVTATDLADNETVADRVYMVDMEGPTLSEATAIYNEETEVVDLTWISGMEDDLAGFRIYRKTAEEEYKLVYKTAAVAEQSDYAAADKSFSTAAASYIYKIEAVDTTGNVTFVELAPVEVPARDNPTAVISADAFWIVGEAHTVDGTASYDDSAVVSYLFDFGDGTTSTEKAPSHIYETEGTYTITLTVTDDLGKTGTVTQEVQVVLSELMGAAKVLVTDEEGVPMKGVYVYFDLGNESQVVKKTDGEGCATFTAIAGSYPVGAVITGNSWRPAKAEMIVTAGTTSEAKLTMVKAPNVNGSFSIDRMTLDEIIDAGIDVNDPANQYQETLRLELTYNNIDLNLVTKPSDDDDDDGNGRDYDPIYLPGGKGDDWDFDWPYNLEEEDRVLVPKLLRDYENSEEVAVALLEIPIGASILKEFFDVRLYIINQMSSEFSLEDVLVELNVPEGLTLMETYTTDGAVVTIAEIPGQTTETLSWILRGDELGEYYVSADLTSTLSEFGTEISTTFKSPDPIEVFGMSNLRLVIDVANELDKGTLYYNVSLVNEGKIDVYRPNITTEDILLEIELFDERNVITAEAYDFNAAQIFQLKLSEKLANLPDTLKSGERLTLHYMSIDQTEYSECRFELEETLLSYESRYGLKVEVVERDLEFFKSSLNAEMNALEKAENTLKDPDAMSAYEYLTTDLNYAYWCMANDLGGLGLSSATEEINFELMSGDFADALGEDDRQQAKKMVLAILQLEAEENAFADYRELLKFLSVFTAFAEKFDETFQPSYLTYEETVSLKNAMKSVSEDYKWELYWGLYGSNVRKNGSTFDIYTKKWMEEHEKLYGEGLKDGKAKWHKFTGDEGMKDVWKGFGTAVDYAEKITDIAEDVASDLSIFVKAQSNINVYNFYLDMLYDYMPDEGIISDNWLLCEVIDDIKEIINSEDIMGKIVDSASQAFFWEQVNNGVEEVITSVGVPSLLLKAFNLTADFANLLFNVSAQHDSANMIRFAACLSDSAKLGLSSKKTIYESSPTEENAQEYMMMIDLLLNIRAVGESQVAQYGKVFEDAMIPGMSSWVIFTAVANYTETPGEMNTWYKWRDYVEDKISRCRAVLLRNPVLENSTGATKPVVNFDYAAGQTVQSFDSSYEYSVNGGATWTTCKDEPIRVARPKKSVELRVRKVDPSGTNEKLTASVTIYGPGNLEKSGIEVFKTESGYRILGLDKERTYMVTFAAEELELTYETVLQRAIPAGSLSYDYVTNEVYSHVYIRTIAEKTRYASEIYSAPMTDMVELIVVTEGAGAVSGTGKYVYGAEATLVATPTGESVFVGWYTETESVPGEGAEPEIPGETEGETPGETTPDETIPEETTPTLTLLSNEPVYKVVMTETTTLIAKFVDASTLEEPGKETLDLKDGFVLGFPEETTAEELMNYYGELGLAVTVPEGTTTLGTGMEVLIGGRPFAIVIKGDVDGDGEVSIMDIMRILDHLNEDGMDETDMTLEGAYYRAACVATDEVSLLDLFAVLDYTNQEESIWP